MTLTATPNLQAITNLVGRVTARTSEPGTDHEAFELADAARRLLQQIDFLHMNLRDMHGTLPDADIVEYLNNWLGELGLPSAIHDRRESYALGAPAEEEPAPTAAVDLMAALRASLADLGSTATKPAAHAHLNGNPKATT